MKDEGPKEMTLDEWKAMQDKERAKVEFNIRKVNEGEDWQKGFVLHKSKAGVSWSWDALRPQPSCVPDEAHFMSMLCVPPTQDKKVELIEPETEEAKVKICCCTLTCWEHARG